MLYLEGRNIVILISTQPTDLNTPFALSPLHQLKCLITENPNIKLNISSQLGMLRLIVTWGVEHKSFSRTKRRDSKEKKYLINWNICCLSPDQDFKIDSLVRCGWGAKLEFIWSWLSFDWMTSRYQGSWPADKAEDAPPDAPLFWSSCQEIKWSSSISAWFSCITSFFPSFRVHHSNQSWHVIHLLSCLQFSGMICY